VSSGAGGDAAYFPDGALAMALVMGMEPVDIDRVEAAVTIA
jgi:hypothetical protein